MAEETKGGARWTNPDHLENPGANAIAANLLGGGRLREQLRHGCAIGTFLIELPCPETVTGIALAGFDYVVLDMEHSSVGLEKLERLILAGHAAGLVVLVRPWTSDGGLLGKVLDMGAHGIMAPHVDSAERAKEIVDCCRFAPRGKRGFSPLTRFDGLANPLEELSAAPLVVLQIEGAAGLERAVDITSVPGVDAAFVGPYDLALSLGVAPLSAEVFSAAHDIAARANPDTPLGIYVDDPASCGDWAQRGFRLQCVSFDGRMLAYGARQVASAARKSIDSATR